MGVLRGAWAGWRRKKKQKKLKISLNDVSISFSNYFLPRILVPEHQRISPPNWSIMSNLWYEHTRAKVWRTPEKYNENIVRCRVKWLAASTHRRYFPAVNREWSITSVDDTQFNFVLFFLLAPTLSHARAVNMKSRIEWDTDIECPCRVGRST